MVHDVLKVWSWIECLLHDVVIKLNADADFTACYCCYAILKNSIKSYFIKCWDRIVLKIAHFKPILILSNKSYKKTFNVIFKSSAHDESIFYDMRYTVVSTPPPKRCCRSLVHNLHRHIAPEARRQHVWGFALSFAYIKVCASVFLSISERGSPMSAWSKTSPGNRTRANGNCI